jgi:hypothetical protein
VVGIRGYVVTVLAGLLVSIFWSVDQFREQLHFYGCPAENKEISTTTLGMESYTDYITPISFSVKVSFVSKITYFFGLANRQMGEEEWIEMKRPPL